MKHFFEFLECNRNVLDGEKISKEEEYLTGGFWKVNEKEWQDNVSELKNIKNLLEPNNEPKLPEQKFNEPQAVKNMEQPRKPTARKEKRKEVSPQQKGKLGVDKGSSLIIKKTSPSQILPKKGKVEENELILLEPLEEDFDSLEL